MKTLKNLILSVFVLLPLLTACDRREFEEPNLQTPVSQWLEEGKELTTIRSLLSSYKGQACKTITDEIYIKGTVVGNNVSGNIFKELHIQDATGGICIRVDDAGLSGRYPIGQDVVIKCQGLTYGEYGTLPQLGLANATNTGVDRIGLQIFAQLHCQRHGDPDKDKISPAVVDLNDLTGSSPLVGTLVTVTNVYFETANGVELYAEQPGMNPADRDNNPKTRNRVLKSRTSSTAPTLTARISSAADFASNPLPKGTGSVTGILTVFNSSLQILFRDFDDCRPERFSESGNVGNGSKDNPFDIAHALANQGLPTPRWIQGYIVGTVAQGADVIDSNDDIRFSGDFMSNTIVLAADANEKNWEKCVVIALPSGSAIRTAVNLSDNPDNLGKLLKVQGVLEKYIGAAGLTTAGAAANFVLDGGGSSGGEGNGSEASPFNVAGAQSNQNSQAAWVKGYIVGGIVDDNNTTSTIDGPEDVIFGVNVRNTAVLIADSKTETDYTKCVVVNLPTGTIRTAVNLKDNPTNLGKELTVQGVLRTYFGIAGVRDLTAYKLSAE